MIKIDRAAVSSVLGVRGNVKVTFSGWLFDGIPFEGKDSEN